MSHLELVHAEFLASTLGEVVKRKDKWSRRQDNALAAVDADASLPPHHKGRWRMNYLMHRAKLLAKAALCGAATPEELSGALEAAWTFRNTCTIVDGWTRFQGVHLVTLEGIVLHVRHDHEKALRCVARGLRPMTKGRGKRPEGMKDAAYCMARCFDSLALTGKRDKAKEEGDAVFDQRSGVVPSVV